MDHPRLVRGFDTVGDLPRDSDRLIDGQPLWTGGQQARAMVEPSTSSITSAS